MDRGRPLWLKLLGGAFYGTWCFAALAVGVGMGWVGQGQVTGVLVQQTVYNAPPAASFGYKDHIYLLVLGADENRSFINQAVTSDHARSDLILCLRLDFQNNAMTGISIPRDLLVELPEYRKRKINAFHEIGGPELAEQAVEKVLGVDVDVTVSLNYRAFQRMVDLAGGVPIFVDREMKWTDRAGDLYIDLKPGRQVLNGYNALGFVRFRHGDNDYNRQKRQKALMLAFKSHIMSDPARLPLIADQSMELLGGALRPDQIASLIRFSQRVGQDNIRLGMVPVIDHRDRSYGWYQTLNEEELPKVLSDFKFRESFLAGRFLEP